ncbi:MAG: AAA family ATPase [Firmicutes bacterium]|nr:AAA family ATPase [Bacillota bacterium]
MFHNPFSGGKPEVFFGRREILQRFEIAMIDQGSDDRAFFFTGTRGSGKTAILEQLSVRAARKKRLVIDLGPEDTILQLVHELAGFEEKTDTISPQASINIFGTGGGISTGSVSKTRRIGRESLQSLLLETCERTKHGILVTVDEVQKVPIEDISSLCNAFQMASRKGHDIMLAVAGLPYAHASVTKHEGCTYLRRASHEELGLFTWEETAQAFSSVFAEIKGLKISDGFLDQLNLKSYGHPYLMQLLGYHLILRMNENSPGKSHEATEREVSDAIEIALRTYERRALQPLLEELSEAEKKYLEAMSDCLDQERLAATSDIADRIGVTQNRLSRARANLIDHGIIAVPKRGKVMFCIPYLADFVKKDIGLSNTIQVARQRRV